MSLSFIALIIIVAVFAFFAGFYVLSELLDHTNAETRKQMESIDMGA